MEIGSIAKPATVSAPAAPPRVESLAHAGAVKTELAPEAATQQAGETDAVRFEPSEGADKRAALDSALRDMIERNTTIDPESREIVYQSVDKRTGEVVRQVPDEALLRLHTYARQLREADRRSSPDATSRRVEQVA